MIGLLKFVWAGRGTGVSPPTPSGGAVRSTLAVYPRPGFAIGSDWDLDATFAARRTGTPLAAGTATWRLVPWGDPAAHGTAVASGTLTDAGGGAYEGLVDAAVTGLLTPETDYAVEVTFAKGGYDAVVVYAGTARYHRADGGGDCPCSD